MTSTRRKYLGGLALAAFLSTGLGLTGCGAAPSAAETAQSTATEQASAAAQTAATTQTTTTASGGSTQSRSAPRSSYWDSCRRVSSPDPYPGICRDYVDTNGDRICDLSQPDPDASASAATMVAADGADNTSHPAGGCPLGPCSICGICSSLS